MQLHAVRAVGGGLPWGGPAATAAQRSALGLVAEGAYGGEEFGAHGSGCWLEPRARLLVAPGEGELTLRLWAPRPTPPRTVVRLDGRVLAGPLDLAGEPTEVRLALPAEDPDGGRLVLVLDSEPFLPSASGSGDSRRLGVVLGGVRFAPRSPSALARALAGDLTRFDRGP